MTEPNSQSTETKDKEVELQKEVTRAHTVTVVGWSVFFCVLVMAITLANAPTWPVAFGVIGIAIAVTIIWSIILKRH
jgi:hypothetical protein